MAKQQKKSNVAERVAITTPRNGSGENPFSPAEHPDHNGNGKNHTPAPLAVEHSHYHPSQERSSKRNLDQTIFVGREKEFAALDEAYTQMLHGKGSVLFVTGEAGLGKTTLIHEWWKDTAIEALTDTNPYPIYAEAACFIPMGNTASSEQGAFQPWAEIVQQIQKIAGSMKSEKKVELKKIIYESAPAWAWALPVVGGIAHAAVETSRLIKKQKEGLDISLNANDQQQVYQQYVNLLHKIADEQPLVIMLDDMHWVDRASVNLLFYLARQISGKRILVIATYRPEDASLSIGGIRHPVLTVKNEIIRYNNGTELPLTQLGETAIRQLLTEMFPQYKVDKKFERWLQKKSDGNALFVTEFIKTLTEDGFIDEHGAFTGNYKHVPVPPSALAVIEERVQRLPAGTRKLLSYAAVEGEEFTSTVLSKLAKKNPAHLLDELQKVQRLGIILTKGRSRGLANKTATVFSFSHSLLHTALYDKLLEEEKSLLHKECYVILKAEWERLASANERTPGLAVKLMTHAEICKEWATAAETAIIAAHGAWNNFSEEDALELIANARRFNDLDASARERHDRIRAEAALLEAEIATHGSRYADALTACATALHHFEKCGDLQRHIFILNLRAEIFHAQGMYEKAEQEAHTALLMVEKTSGMKEQAYLLQTLGRIRCSQGLYDEALAYHNRSMEIRDSAGDRAGIADSLSNTGAVYRAIGAYEDALVNYKQSLEISESLNSRTSIGTLLLNIGEVYAVRGAYEEALTYLRRSLSINETIGDRPAVAYSLDMIGSVYNSLGSYDVAHAYHEQSLQIREAIGDRAGIANSLHNIGLVYGKLGAYNDALDFFNRSLEMRQTIGDRAGIATSLHHAGLVYDALGAYDDALDYFERSLDIRRTIGDRAGIAASLVKIGAVYTMNGAYNNALVYFTRALELQENMNDHAGVATTLYNMGLLHRKKGELEKSRAALERANTLAEKLRTKDIWGCTFCELGLLSEAEAASAKGKAHSESLHNAIDHLERGIRILSDIRVDGVARYQKELTRLKNTAE
ncbi:MAG TPA: tetratricopeptide repeat protein [Candidatus Kapabacteria bacterium]|nr:tetratricopeptide repeat protein [Candidatus Kapabacteria bacterium]